MAKNKATIWSAVGAEVFLGAADGADVGFTGVVTITRITNWHDIKASAFGDTILDRRKLSQMYRVEIQLKQIGDTDFFKDWWLEGDSGDKLHSGVIGDSAPTRRIRVHPTQEGDVYTKDWVFETCIPDGDPVMSMDAQGDHIHTFAFITIPDSSDYNDINIGEKKFTPA